MPPVELQVCAQIQDATGRHSTRHQFPTFNLKGHQNNSTAKYKYPLWTTLSHTNEELGDCVPLGLQCWTTKTMPPISGGPAFRFVPLMILVACSGKPSGVGEDGIAELGATISGDAIVATDTGSVSGPDTEICDGIDNDGDGEIDEGLLNTYYIDGDGDGYGSEAVEACEAPEGSADAPGDCDDGDPSIHPGADEVCNDIDDDCDLVIDEGLTHTYFLDNDGDGFGGTTDAVTACSPPEHHVDNSLDCDDTSSVISPDQFEICNGIDDDCDGRIDDGVSVMFYPDEDGDGFGVLEDGAPSCGDPDGHSTVPGDCDDSAADIHPLADEICNDLDDDCDGVVDDHPISGTILYWMDGDGDGHGAGAPSEACEIPDGHAGTGDDCDDTDDTRSPSMVEVCNEIDDDCDTMIDEGVLSEFFVDNDGDGYGTASIFACSLPPGAAVHSGDCDDERGTTHPTAPEICDATDNDCDGFTDEEPIDGTTWYGDIDGDGHGDASYTTVACTIPLGHVTSSDDCDPIRGDVFPGADEYCDGRDNDCNGIIDDDTVATPIWYRDDDGDGHGEHSSAVESCEAPEGYVSSDDDCDDDDDERHSGADETCDGIDNDCDGEIDNDAIDMVTVYFDDDGDGYGISSTETLACEPGADWSYHPGDCDDTEPGIHPEASESCDGVDQDCNGVVDNGASGCSCPQFNSGTHSYLVCTSDKRWTQARDFCTAQGYYLATVNNWDEQDMLLDELEDYDDSFWIGLNDRGHGNEGDFTWVNGESATFRAFDDGQPDNWFGEDCVEMNWRRDGTDDWNDQDCNNYDYFLCEASP